VELLGAEDAVHRHDAVAEPPWICDVAFEEAERLTASPDRAEVVAVEVPTACTEVRVADETAALGEEPGTGDGTSIPGEALASRPAGNGSENLRPEDL
jgi:hypothetical protein